MRNVAQALTRSTGLTETDDRKEEQIAAVLLGLEELAAYTGSRPHQRCEFKMSAQVYLKFWQLTKKLRDESTSGKDCEDKKKVSFSAFLPFPLFLKFKELNQELQRTVPSEHKDAFTMTSWGNLVTSTIIIPALEGVVLRTSVDEDFKSEVLQNKDKYTMTAWFTASVEKIIIPAIREAINHVNATSSEKLQAA